MPPSLTPFLTNGTRHDDDACHELRDLQLPFPAEEWTSFATRVDCEEGHHSSLPKGHQHLAAQLGFDCCRLEGEMLDVMPCGPVR